MARTYRHWSEVPEDVLLADYNALQLGCRAFTAQMWDTLIPDRPYIESYCSACVIEHYQEWLDPNGCIQNLIVNQPIRTGKSINLVFALGYDWLLRPSMKWMCGTYKHELSKTDARNARIILNHPRYQALMIAVGYTEYGFASDQNTLMRFTNTYEGSRYGLVVGAGHGQGAHRLVIDDPIDPLESRSKNKRERCINWWRETFRQRFLDPNAVRRLIVQQRIHQWDLTGYVIENEKNWEHLVLPMRYEPKRIIFTPDVQLKTISDIRKESLIEMANQNAATDPIKPTKLQLKIPALMDAPQGSGRSKEGDLLWPNRFDEVAVREMEATLADAASGQLAQRPSSATGSIFQVGKSGIGVGRFDSAKKLVEIELMDYKGNIRKSKAETWRMFQVFDTATKTEDHNSWTVCGTVMLSDLGEVLIWNLFRERLEVPNLMPAVMELKAGEFEWDFEAKTGKKGDRWPLPLLARYVEPKSSGIGIIQDSMLKGGMLRALEHVPGDKVERSGHTSALFHEGKIFFRPGPWVTYAKEELRLFPNADFNDVADVFSYIGIVVANDQMLRVHINRRLVLNKTKAEEDRRQPVADDEIEAMMSR